jgi:hypothetical protein
MKTGFLNGNINERRITMEDIRYYRITYSCGCGESEEYITAKDDDAAVQYAYECAVEDYHSFEGLHGVLSETDIAEEMFADLYSDEDYDEFNLVELTDSDWEDVMLRYQEEIENTIDYYAEEITKKEYEEGLGLFWDEKEVHDHETQLAADDEEEDLLVRIAELSDENATLNARVAELTELLTLAKDDMLYLLMDNKAKDQRLNTQGLAGLYILRSEYELSEEKCNADFARISDYLEENK